jgi:hypothetical protein
MGSLVCTSRPRRWISLMAHALAELSRRQRATNRSDLVPSQLLGGRRPHSNCGFPTVNHCKFGGCRFDPHRPNLLIRHLQMYVTPGTFPRCCLISTLLILPFKNQMNIEHRCSTDLDPNFHELEGNRSERIIEQNPKSAFVSGRRQPFGTVVRNSPEPRSG